ncbi:radical SAM protein, partial [Streptomyces sp. 15-116A]|nr:radical SAM protein [Streptomyces sp. 15-116A]
AGAGHTSAGAGRPPAGAGGHPPGLPALRPDRAPWPDSRTHAFAVPSADPRTPDEHLAAGDAAAALEGYAKELVRRPGDAHLLAGWIVARAVLEPGSEARRMLARPELLQP